MPSCKSGVLILVQAGKAFGRYCSYRMVWAATGELLELIVVVCSKDLNK